MSTGPRPGGPGRWRPLLEWLTCTMVLAGALLWIDLSGDAADDPGGGRGDALVFDALRIVAPVAPDPGLVVLAIDDDSLSQVGQWPWSRAVHAALIERLREAGAAAVALDILLTEPGDGDAALTDALRAASRAGLPVTMAVGAVRSAEPGRPEATTPLYPLPAFGLAAGLAHPHLRTDHDGVVRGLYLEEAGFPALAVRALQARPLSGPAAAALAGATPARRDEAVAAADWPLRHFVLLPRLARAPDTVSAGALLRGEAGAAQLKGRTVLIGATAQGLGDRYATGIVGDGMPVPGVLLHAAAVSAIAADRTIQPVPRAAGTAVGLLLLLGLMALLYRTRPSAGMFAVGVGLAGVAALAGAGLLTGWWWSPTGTLSALALAHPLWSWRRLEAATAGIRRQAGSLAPEADGPVDATAPLPVARRTSSEPVARSLARLDGAAGANLRLRRFLQLTLQRLPHPAFVVDERGLLRVANDAAVRAFGDAPPPGTPLAAWLQAHRGPALPEPAATGQHECSDPAGRDWLLDASHFQNGDLPDTTLLQLVDISRIRHAERERDLTMRFLSHDLRSPQAAILAIVAQARRGSDPAATLDAIERQAERTLTLADGFVQLARADAQPLALTALDLADLVTEAIDAQWVIARGRGQRLEATGLREGAWVDGDRALLTRALGNLVDNALKFSPPDTPIEIALQAAPGPLDDPAQGWRLTVSDRGPGVRPEDIERLFQPWERASATADRPGSGLGLSFVRRAVERHGGRAHAAPREGGGARFTIDLPATPVDGSGT